MRLSLSTSISICDTEGSPYVHTFTLGGVVRRTAIRRQLALLQQTKADKHSYLTSLK